MKKTFRIVEKTYGCGRKTYYAQQRSFFFWWETVCSFGLTDFSSIGQLPKEFDTQEDVETRLNSHINHLKSLSSTKKTVSIVKEK